MRRKAKKTKSKTYLHLEIENFGPIKEADIELRPLTIFIGQNNSGKSYTAMLIHAILEAHIFNRLVYPLRRGRSRFSDPIIRERVNKIIEDKQLMGKIKKFLDKIKVGEEVTLPNEIKKIFISEIISICKNILDKELIQVFAVEPEKLVRFNHKLFRVKILSTQRSVLKPLVTIICEKYNIKNENIKIKLSRSLENQILFKVRKRETNGYVHIEIKKEKEKTIINAEISKDISILIFVDMLFISLLDNVLAIIPGLVSYYLPSARSGILQGHKAIISGILRELPYLGIKKVEIPTFPGVITNFLAYLVGIDPDKKSEFYELAKMIESEILKGEIKLDLKEEYTLPEIVFSQHGEDIPIHIASSGVSELAPLILYLKYIVEPGSLLIIEEPEAHLHPEAQRTLAKYIVRLVRKGVKVLITTHSDYLLEQLSNFVILSNLPSDKRKELCYDENDYIEPDEVSFYLFKITDDGVITERLEVSKEEGIPQDAITKVQEEMYREYITLKSIALGGREHTQREL